MATEEKYIRDLRLEAICKNSEALYTKSYAIEDVSSIPNETRNTLIDLYEAGLTYKQLAKKFGIKESVLVDVIYLGKIKI